MAKANTSNAVSIVAAQLAAKSGAKLHQATLHCFRKAGHAAGSAQLTATAHNATELAALLGKLPEWTKPIYDAIRAEWTAGYAESFGCTDKRSGNAWREAFNAAGELVPGGLVKPQNPEAARKAQQRAATAPSKASKAAPVKAPAKGADVASGVQLVLSGIEAHIIDLFRRHQFDSLLKVLADEAKTAAPM
jgi:hypothetical protein